eukprot:TRINITY_DN4802_c0_g1_i2.p1 TRINITY_DN4802_c0_g1~~TRINITY_DN4802_c0_g1_i2.p1  ORF type:complete len:1288 (+),score=415.25 TRINITY_DN4802_c0_g1_i2:50-3865(+)
MRPPGRGRRAPSPPPPVVLPAAVADWLRTAAANGKQGDDAALMLQPATWLRLLLPDDDPPHVRAAPATWDAVWAAAHDLGLDVPEDAAKAVVGGDAKAAAAQLVSAHAAVTADADRAYGRARTVRGFLRATLRRSCGELPQDAAALLPPAAARPSAVLRRALAAPLPAGTWAADDCLSTWLRHAEAEALFVHRLVLQSPGADLELLLSCITAALTSEAPSVTGAAGAVAGELLPLLLSGSPRTAEAAWTWLCAPGCCLDACLSLLRDGGEPTGRRGRVGVGRRVLRSMCEAAHTAALVTEELPPRLSDPREFGARVRDVFEMHDPPSSFVAALGPVGVEALVHWLLHHATASHEAVDAFRPAGADLCALLLDLCTAAPDMLFPPRPAQVAALVVGGDSGLAAAQHALWQAQLQHTADYQPAGRTLLPRSLRLAAALTAAAHRDAIAEERKNATLRTPTPTTSSSQPSELPTHVRAVELLTSAASAWVAGLWSDEGARAAALAACRQFCDDCPSASVSWLLHAAEAGMQRDPPAKCDVELLLWMCRRQLPAPEKAAVVGLLLSVACCGQVLLHTHALHALAEAYTDGPPDDDLDALAGAIATRLCRAAYFGEAAAELAVPPRSALQRHGLAVSVLRAVTRQWDAASSRARPATVRSVRAAVAQQWVQWWKRGPGASGGARADEVAGWFAELGSGLGVPFPDPSSLRAPSPVAAPPPEPTSARSRGAAALSEQPRTPPALAVSSTSPVGRRRRTAPALAPLTQPSGRQRTGPAGGRRQQSADGRRQQSADGRRQPTADGPQPPADGHRHEALNRARITATVAARHAREAGQRERDDAERERERRFAERMRRRFAGPTQPRVRPAAAMIGAAIAVVCGAAPRRRRRRERSAEPARGTAALVVRTNVEMGAYQVHRLQQEKERERRHEEEVRRDEESRRRRAKRQRDNARLLAEHQQRQQLHSTEEAGRSEVAAAEAAARDPAYRRHQQILRAWIKDRIASAAAERMSAKAKGKQPGRKRARKARPKNGALGRSARSGSEPSGSQRRRRGSVASSRSSGASHRDREDGAATAIQAAVRRRQARRRSSALLAERQAAEAAEEAEAAADEERAVAATNIQRVMRGKRRGGARVRPAGRRRGDERAQRGGGAVRQRSCLRPPLPQRTPTGRQLRPLPLRRPPPRTHRRTPTRRRRARPTLPPPLRSRLRPAPLTPRRSRRLRPLSPQPLLAPLRWRGWRRGRTLRGRRETTRPAPRLAKPPPAHPPTQHRKATATLTR